MTQRIERFLKIWLKELNALKIWLKELNALKMWLKELNTLKIWLKELTTFLKIVLKELNPFENIGHRIELFWKYDSQNWTRLSNMTDFFFSTWLIEIEPFFSTWLKEIEPICSVTWRIFFFFKIYDSNKWIIFGKHDSKNWTLFEYDSQNWFFFFEKWPIELNLFNEPFFNMTQRIELLQWLKDFNFWKKLTQRIELFSWIWRKEVDLFFDSEFYPLLNATQRFEPIFQTWLKELNPFLVWLKEFCFFSKFFLTQRFFLERMTQRIEPDFFKYDSKKWTFLWLEEFDFFYSIWIKELSLFSNLTQKNWTSFMNMTQRVCFV